jgi:hypothetical protein
LERAQSNPVWTVIVRLHGQCILGPASSARLPVLRWTFQVWSCSVPNR